MEEKIINKRPAITFSDVLIEPCYSEVISRKNGDISSQLHEKICLKLPVISSNMATITGPKMAKAMYDSSGLGILHRFCSIEKAVEDFKTVVDSINMDLPLLHPIQKDPNYNVGVSIGVKDQDKERFAKLYEAGARLFVVDVAHGHSILVKNMLKYIKSQNIKDVILIAGNVATSWGAQDLKEWGADIVKVGIGPSSVCLTRTQTKIGVPQLQALINIREKDPDIKIISDGGIKCSGDVCCAMIFSDAVMIGTYINGVSESPGFVYKNEQGQYYKTYGGSASKENKVQNGQEGEFVEGATKIVPFRGHVKYILREISDSLRSSFSYCGASNLKEFKEYAKLIEISGGSRNESKF